jgi:hypothetical protein
MKGYSIYRDNTVIYEFVVDDTISKSLSGNKYVSFTISSKNDLDLKIGDYVLVGNEKYEIFEPIDIEESNGVFTYPLTFYFQGYKLNNSIITDEGATTFAYHGEVSDFMTLLIDSLNEDYPEFTLGTIQNGSILDLSFDNSNCMAALQTVCENAEMEWDITGTVITVKRRIGEETDYVFEYGKNKGSYSVKLAKVANASVTTRMIGKGGTLNLPADYDSPDSPKRLNLGDEVIEKNVEKYGKITGVYVNENIYPRLINKTVLGVTVPENIEEAGSWKIKLDIPFNLSEYYAENEIPVVKFQTGDLTGLNFEIVENSWNNTDKTLSIIVKEEEDGYYLPNANRQPRVGDVFVLLNINMPQSYIDEATQELREATQNELNKKCEPQYAPSLSVQKHYIKKKGISLNIGDGITVKIGRRNITTRIIGTTETSDDIRVELGDQMLYTYDTKVNNTIEQIQFTLKQLINIDDIKRLFYNLINAWYPKWFNQKLHKDADVEFNSVKAAELVQSDNFSSKNFTSGALGSGHRIKDGNAEFQNLTVRGQFSVFEFLIQQVKAIGGKFCVSPAAIKTESVEETENGYKCFFNTDSGTIINPFVVGDQAFHQVFDGQKMKRYWRLVTEVGADYFVLSKTDCEANSGIPEADEEIVLLGNRTDINRQSAIMISAHDNNSPYIAFYAGINSYSFEGKEPMRTGNLNGIVDEDFGQLTGFGLYCQNVYMKGVFRLMSGKTVEESIGDVQSNLDNLQVGETNLLDNSNKGWKNTSYPIATIYLGDYKPKQGEECTIVIKGKLGANKTSWDVYNSGGNVVLASFYPGGPDTDYIALKTFKWTLGTPAVDNTFIRIYPMPNSVSVESEIEWVKLVLGNKTSLLWTPSINDQKQIAIDEAGKVVDGIQIGGVNILIGSTTGTGWTGYTEHKDTEFSIKDASTGESYIRSAMITIPGNKEIVVSFYAKHTGHQNYFDFYILPASYPEINALLTSSYQSGTDWTYNEFKFTTPSDWGEGTLVYLRIDHNGMSDGSEFIISVKDVQIEYGNKATTYSVPESDRKEIAKQQGLEGGQEAVNGLQIGSQNLISKKMMLKWNEKNKDIAVWGQDEDGVYLNVNHKLLTDYVSGGLDLKDVFGGAIKFKTNTQYVFSVEWKVSANGENDGIRFIFLYTDGSIQYVSLKGNQTTKARINYVTDPGKTISKISSSHGFYAIQSLIYNISLIEGNKPLQGFPVAEEDQTGANNVNLADGTKEFTIGVRSANYTYKELYVSKIKPNTVYYVNAQNIEVLSGNADKCDFILYDKAIKNYLTPTYHHLYDKNGGILITKNDFEAQEGYLLCYAGESGHTAGNSVRFTEVMLVEGFLPAPVWTPSFAEQQTGIDAANSAAKLAQQTAENAQITATEATTKLNNWASDSLISPPEKPAMRQQQADIQAEYKEIKANVEKYSLTDNAAWINYNNAYSLANTALTKYTASSPENITISSDYSNIAACYPKRQEILNAISSAAIDAAKEYTTLKTYRETYIDLRAEKWDQDTYYPVTIKLSNPETRIEVFSPLTPDFGTPKWSTHVGGFSINCVWRSNGSSWGANVVKRTIEVFGYRFTKEIPDTTPVQYILPAGSIEQLISSSEELIYLRGGGRYLFKIGNNCVAVVHDSRYTAPDGTAVAPVTSVIRPVLTNATKEELNTEINITKGLIENKVSLDVYNENDQLIKSDISNLQVSYDQISSTVSKIINGTQEISGVVTQSNFVTIFSSNKNALGQEVIESINVGGGGVTIDASRINLNGAISANGNVQITTDGKLIAVNGQFTGKITATEGEIAGLKLSNNGLRSSDFNASSKVGSCYAKNGFSVYASGSGILKPSTGGMQAGIITAVGDFISHITGLEIIAKETSYNSGSSSKVTALRIQADNRYYGTPFDPPLAIEVVSGDVLFGGKMTVNNTSIFRGQIYINPNNIPNISGASNYYLCINRSTGQLSYR